jgi:large subunit ribosomal protein L23
MSKAKYFDIIRHPIITEKATVIGANNQYVFKVAIDSTKESIKKAISHVFGVNVVNVNTIICKGKEKRFKGFLGKRNNYKKAIITLEPGQQIDTTLEV